MSATLAQLLSIHSREADACLAYLRALIATLGEQPLLQRFGRSLDDAELRIPLHVEPFDAAKLRDRQAQEERERDNLSMRAGEPDAEKRIYSHRSSFADDASKDNRAKPEPLDTLLDTLEVAMLLGDPGGGKSECLKGLAVRTARRVFAQLDRHLAFVEDVCLPVFAELPSVAELFGDSGKLEALRTFGQAWLHLSGRSAPTFPDLGDDEPRLRVAVLKAAVNRLGIDNDTERERCAPALRKIWRDWSRPHQLGAKRLSGALLLLDAWDEVPGQFRTDEFKVRILALSRQPPVRIVATSRIVGFEPGVLDTPTSSQPGALRRVLTILPLRYEDTEQFIRAFFPVGTTADRLLADLRPKPMVMAMLQNPLLATLVCLAFDPEFSEPVPLPARRAEVYRGVVRRLLGKEEAVRKDRVQRADDVVEEIETILQHLAYFVFPDEIFTKQTLSRFCRDFVIPAGWGLNRYLDQRHDGSLFACLTGCGLLTGYGESELRFLHLTFEEFFVAGRLAAEVNKVGWDSAMVPIRCGKRPVRVSLLVDKKAWDPRWFEVVALTAGQISPQDAPIEPLLEELSGCADDIHHHRLCLATRCLAEAQAFDRSPGAIAARLGESAWRLFIDSVGEISDPRLGQSLAVANPPIAGHSSMLALLAGSLRDPGEPYGARQRAVRTIDRIGAAAATREFLSVLAAETARFRCV